MNNSILIKHNNTPNNVDDLFSIKTLGFRGEALASMASISDFTVITNQSDISGIKLNVMGGKEVSVEKIGTKKGTTIIIKNLFFRFL